nr:uncharacterized protein LOC124815329 [Hydra vulgaris]
MASNNILKEENLPKTFSLCTFNCQGLKSNIKYTETLIISHDITFLCEHWISKLEYSIIKNICKNSHSLYFSQANKHEQSRPFGGNAFFIRKNQFQNIISLYEDENIFVIKLKKNYIDIIVVGIYLTLSRNNQKSLEKYKSQLDILKGIINSHKGNGEVIILGDFQSFPHGIYDLFERTSSKRNNYSLILSEFIESNELELVDVTKGSGPAITYQHLTLLNTSYIDHIAISKHTSLLVYKCIVNSPFFQNVSDHLPLSISIGIKGHYSQKRSLFTRKYKQNNRGL